MRKQLLILPFVSLLLVSCGNNVDKTNPGDDLIITSIEMINTYGDSTLIQYQDYDILIDTGTNRDALHINSVLNDKVSDKKIELLIFTHPHGDHIGGMINNCLTGLEIETIVDYGYTYITNGNDEIDNSGYVADYVYKRDNLNCNYYGIKEALKKIPTVYIDKKEDCYLKWLKQDYYYDTTFPNESVPDDNPNITSVCCYVHYKKWNIVLCGDADSSFTEMSLINNYPNLFKKDDRVILKATHHGAGSSDGYNFLEWCHPELIYISAAMVNSVCVPNTPTIGTGDGAQAHPARATLRRLLNTTDNVYWNAINGDIEIKIDGINDYTLSGKGRSKDYYDISNNVVDRNIEKNVRIQDSAFYQYFK